MEPQLIFQIAFFSSIAFSVIAWSLVARHLVWPRLQALPRIEALRPLLLIHSFRFVGLSFLVPGVVASDIPQAFARDAAFGDIAAAVLALLTLATLRNKLGTVLAWVFSLWGMADLINAFYQARVTGLSPSQLGAAYYIPTVAVPLLFVSHVLVLRLLARRPA